MDPTVIKEMSSHPPELKCPRCDGELEEGLVPNGIYGMPLVWREGGVLSFFDFFGLTRKRLKIKGFRCVECGRLELFANPEN